MGHLASQPKRAQCHRLFATLSLSLVAAVCLISGTIFSQQGPRSEPGSPVSSGRTTTSAFNSGKQVAATNQLQQFLGTNAHLNETFLKLKAAEKDFVSKLAEPETSSAAKKLRRTITHLRLDPQVQAKESELRQLIHQRLLERIGNDPEQLKVFKLVKEHQDHLKRINTNDLTPVFLFGN